MRVLLVSLSNPVALDPAIAPSLGLLYIGAVLKRDLPGIVVNYLDFSTIQEDYFSDSWLRHLPLDYDVYCITAVTGQVHCLPRICDYIRKMAPGSKIVVGGPHANALPEETLEITGADHVVQGEGETVMAQIVLGLVSDRIVKASFVEDLNDLPLPDRDLVDYSRYHKKVMGRPAIDILSSRGCLYHCAFCGGLRHKRQHFRLRHPDSFIEEVKEVVGRHGVSAISIVDDSLTFDKKRLETICKALAPLGIPYSCLSTAKPLTDPDPDIVQLLAESGCVLVSVGIESFSNKVLTKLGKVATAEINKQAIMECRRGKLPVRAFLMYGSPGESADTIDETIQGMRDATPDAGYLLMNFVPYPGCKIWANPMKFGVTLDHKQDRADLYRNYWLFSDDRPAAQLDTMCETEWVRNRQRLIRSLRELYEEGA